MTIRKLLVANRGEIAARIIRTARAMDIATVAVFSDPDADAPFVAAADEAVRLPGATPGETYLRGELIVAAARATGADAVHPGYGFLSENAGFARACADAGLVFVGPSPEAIEAMGSKTAAKERMAAAGVPTLPGAVIGARGELDEAALRRAGEGIGYPLLVKAAFGGGGRGMRIVRAPDELAEAVAGARREAASAFGDGTVFLERFVERPRHVEVQVFGDTHGTVVHLFERECSIQRRYQKIVEEAPSPAVTPELRAELGAAAVAAAKAIDYVGAGTVEFVLDQSGRFFFLEVNTRLQVEHPVTELVTGLDLVRVQLQVADGEPLPDEVTGASITGHAVEVRLYAEDVPAGFLPVTGTLHRFAVPALPGVRVDAGVIDGSVVSTYYDPMLAKVIAYGPTRDAACRTLARALADAHLHGVTTNRDLLVGLLREDEFRRGAIDTGYLERHDPAELSRNPQEELAVRVHALAAALAGAAARRTDARVQATIPAGWRNVPNADASASFGVGDRTVDVAYRFGRDGVRASVDGERLDVTVGAVTAERVTLTVDGVRRTVDVHRVGDTSFCDSALGATELVEAERFPEPVAEEEAGSLHAPMPGTVVRVEVEEGAPVGAGTVVVVLEAMKMEHAVRAPHDGVVTSLHADVGQAVDTGHVLAVVTG
ncbi:acetyl/propionyl/methylcrotonyl-CoA carboxylase subunit alpha [Petropleomorpha daqingensis]|uniref:Biotin-dependent 3-methylcrotonyl-coenzyme A carboxylase alpha1 subunit n=1 Tax=Petropleomorpha daqingensis TaxID=2026353 RepID=A0A853CRT3_9ACTN|nr:biotin carboxylase N-terminal domain-containing protein [Petropleomorpha daqingensis]NYJ08613.1 acetyl/propionyl-CoA carboxylase alpha subunit [Petropleomorpha daqingensis]